MHHTYHDLLTFLLDILMRLWLLWIVNMLALVIILILDCSLDEVEQKISNLVNDKIVIEQGVALSEIKESFKALGICILIKITTSLSIFLVLHFALFENSWIKNMPKWFILIQAFAWVFMTFGLWVRILNITKATTNAVMEYQKTRKEKMSAQENLVDIKRPQVRLAQFFVRIFLLP